MTTPTQKKTMPKSMASRLPQKKKPSSMPSVDNSLQWLFYMTGVTLVFIAAIGLYVFENLRTDILLTVDKQGQLAELQSMDTPNTSSEAIINWSKLAVSEVFTYNFNNVANRMLGAQRFFTPLGWDSFTQSARDSNILSKVISQRQFVTTIPTNEAVIAAEFEEKGRYYWIVQITTLTSAYTGTTTTLRDGVTLKVTQIPSHNSDAGYTFGITQITR